ncbi:MAG TPA: hypothetical protein VF120_15895 [Ktedonobacterales bacterium]
MSLPLFFALLTLAPAVAAVLIAALGLANRPIARVVGILTIVGALIPLAALLYLVADLSSGMPLRLTLFGPVGPGTWLSLAYRSDAFSVYAAFGVVVVIAPLLLWMVWRSLREPDGAAESAEAPEPLVGETALPAATGPSGATAPETAAMQPAQADWRTQLLSLEEWGGYALVLGLESAALVLCFADSIVWFGVAWIALAILAWAVGELGAEPADLDRRSLILMALGPILWLVAMLPIASPVSGSRLSDLAGLGNESVLLVFVVLVFLALSGGVYPFNGWVRRRAIFTPPVGFGAVVLALLPAALFAGARTYAALQSAASSTPDSANLWPQLGAAVPPITIGIVLVLLGAVTVAICGLLALAFRDGRTLIALLATAQVGWGMLALGIGRPLSAAALVVLLATAVLGLGAMVASLFAGGMLTRGEEPEGAGPRAFGAVLQPVNLIAWILGAVALVGAPLFGGFISRQLTTASSLSAAQLTIPLTGLAWVGDALLAFALVRATVPAWFSPAKVTLAPEGAVADAVGLEVASDLAAAGTPPAEAATIGTATAAKVEQALTDAQAQTPEAEVPEAAESEEDEEDEDEGELDEEDEADEDLSDGTPRGPSLGERLRTIQPEELIGLVLGVLALVIGIVPNWLFALGGLDAAQTLLQPGTLAPVFQVTTLGYVAAASQWLPSLAWIAVAILAVLAALVAEVTKPAPRVARALAPEAVPAALPEGAEPGVEPGELEPEPQELNSLAEPTAVWKDLSGAIDSNWTVPGVTWLLSDLEEEGATTAEGSESDEGLLEPPDTEDADDVDDGEDAENIDTRDAVEQNEGETDVPPSPGSRPARARGEGTNEQP